jgi:hypothetical protein
LDLTFYRERERTRWDAKVLTGTIEALAAVVVMVIFSTAAPEEAQRR